MKPRRAVFLDRDGTLNVEQEGYLLDPSQMVLIPGAGSAVRKLNDAGVPVVVITNQACVAKGLLTADDLEAVHVRLRELLAATGAHLDAIQVCPHRDEDSCNCRKPLPGLLEAAAAALTLNLSDSYLVGDDERDLVAADAAGVRPVLVRTGKGRRVEGSSSVEAAHVADDVECAVDWILGHAGDDI